MGNIDYSDPNRKLVEADVEVRLFAVNQCFDLLKTALKLIDDRLAAGSSTSTAASIGGRDDARPGAPGGRRFECTPQLPGRQCRRRTSRRGLLEEAKIHGGSRKPSR